MMDPRSIAYMHVGFERKKGVRKHLGNHANVAAAWAAQSQEEGKANRVYFVGPTIYSYGSHFPMGSHVVNKDGRRAVLVNAATYSNSTSKHQSHMRAALRKVGLPEFYTTTHAIQVWSDDDDDNNASHFATLDYMLEQAKASFAKVQRARSRKRQYVADAKHYLSEAKRYIEFFSLDLDALRLALALDGEALSFPIDQLADKIKPVGAYLDRLDASVAGVEQLGLALEGR